MLPATLTEALANVSVEDAHRVVLGDRTVGAESPRELRQQLCTALYEDWHAGIVRSEVRRSPHRDGEFEQTLMAATPHRTSKTSVKVRSEPVEGPDGAQVLTEINRVRVRLPLDTLSDGAEVGSSVTVALPAIRPSLSPGFLLLNGSAGGPRGGEILRLYVHVAQPADAPGVWRAVLETLEDRGTRYRAKVISKAASFPRRDSVVVYLDEEAWPAVPALVDAVAGVPGIAADTSRFVHRVRAGIALAWDPRDARPGWDRMSFGQHRCGAVADGIVRHIDRGADLPLADAVEQALAEASVDPCQPAMNTSSPAFPTENAAVLAGV